MTKTFLNYMLYIKLLVIWLVLVLLLFLVFFIILLTNIRESRHCHHHNYSVSINQWTFISWTGDPLSFLYSIILLNSLFFSPYFTVSNCSLFREKKRPKTLLGHVNMSHSSNVVTSAIAVLSLFAVFSLLLPKESFCDYNSS